MAVTLSPSDKYINPVGFRTSLPPAVTHVDEVQTLMVRYVTDKHALELVLPDFFEIPDEPIITIAHAHNIGVDWLGGRTYRLARVDTQVTYRGEEETVTGPFTLIVWESDAKPVIVGRELQGYQKLVGEVPPHVLTATGGSFECLEYEAPLLRGRLSGLEDIPESALKKMQEGLDKSGHVALGWKYIPAPQGGADVNYVTRLPMNGRLVDVQRGTGEIEFYAPEWAAAPGSAHIMAALRALPILEYRSALRTKMVDVTLPRDQARRIR